jgi:hypothetical protein
MRPKYGPRERSRSRAGFRANKNPPERGFLQSPLPTRAGDRVLTMVLCVTHRVRKSCCRAEVGDQIRPETPRLTACAPPERPNLDAFSGPLLCADDRLGGTRHLPPVWCRRRSPAGLPCCSQLLAKRDVPESRRQLLSAATVETSRMKGRARASSHRHPGRVCGERHAGRDSRRGQELPQLQKTERALRARRAGSSRCARTRYATTLRGTPRRSPSSRGAEHAVVQRQQHAPPHRVREPTEVSQAARGALSHSVIRRCRSSNAECLGAGGVLVSITTSHGGEP